MTKFFQKIVKNIIEEHYVPYKIDQKGSFRAGRSFENNVFILIQVIEQKLSHYERMTINP